MRARVLSPEEWGRLDVSGLPVLLPHVTRAGFEAHVVEDASGEIVATLGVLHAPHFEGLWIAPEHRGNPAVGRQLIGITRRAVAASPNRMMFAFAADDTMRSVLMRLGATYVPATCHVLALPRSMGNA